GGQGGGPVAARELHAGQQGAGRVLGSAVGLGVSHLHDGLLQVKHHLVIYLVLSRAGRVYVADGTAFAGGQAQGHTAVGAGQVEVVERPQKLGLAHNLAAAGRAHQLQSVVHRREAGLRVGGTGVKAAWGDGVERLPVEEVAARQQRKRAERRNDVVFHGEF
nr:hypothetical protein [Tanacetum cinerariifolium]